MFIAVAQDGRRLSPSKGISAFCPSCKQEVVAKIGQIRAPHWGHKVTSDCTHGQGMTQWHYDWLNTFANRPDWNVEVPHGHHRLDAFSDVKKIALEFQLSIDSNYIKSKTNYCLSQGIAVIWLFRGIALKGYQLRADCYQATSAGKRVLHEILHHFKDHSQAQFLVHDSRIKASVDGAVAKLSAPAVTSGIVHAALKFSVEPPESFIASLCR